MDKKNISKGLKTQIAIILLVGICVSASFYFISNQVVGIKLHELQEYKKVRVQDVIEKDFWELERNVTEVVELAQALPVAEYKSNESYKFHSPRISSLFWIDAKELSLQKNIKAVPFLNHYSAQDAKWLLTSKNIQEIKNNYRVFSKKDLGVVKSISIEGKGSEDFKGEWQQNYRLMVLTTLLKSQDGKLGILVAVVDPVNVFNRSAIYKDLGISNVSVKVTGLTDNLIEMSWSAKDATLLGNAVQKNYNHKFSHADFQKVHKVKLELRQSYSEALLAMIPWSVLFVSVGLTLIYVLMKSSSMKRARELSKLNEGLALKNIELKAEIKKREAMNSVIRQSEQENKAIINSISEVIFELDTQANIMFVNDTWQRVTGYSPAEAIKTNLFSYLNDDEGAKETEKLQDLLDGRTATYSSSFRLKSKNGRLKPIEMKISMLRQDQKKNLRVVGTLTDLDEKEKAEQAIVQAEENYKRIWKNAANGIYEVDLNGQLISANPAMAKILGYENTDQLISFITDMSNMVYVSPEEKDAQIALATEERSSQKFEIKAYRKDGREIWLEEFIQPVMDDAGQIMHLEGTIDDITERKEVAHELLKAKAESDMANRAKSDFLANMSHELRTPLNSIIGFAEIIRDQVMGEIKEPVYTEYAGEIHKSGNGLLAIINQILDVSKIESGNRELNESLVKLEKSVSDTIRLFSEKIKDKQITVTNNVDASVSDLIAEDRSVKQMLYNIMSNAVKFTALKGSITIDAMLDEDQNLKVSITDNGEGLTPEQVDRALKPFDLLDGEHSRETYGAGLGLTLVKLLMDMHGGHIDMQSEKNVGTTVSLVFPKERIRGYKKQTAEENKEATPSIDMTGFEEADVFDTGSKSIH